MSNQDTFLDALIKALQSAGTYNTSDQIAPAAILWPDKDRQWEALLPVLRERLPLLTYGAYKPEERTGPAYWLRCMIARTLPADKLPEGSIPIIYLPGVSRQEIKTVENTPKMLKTLIELQYRGVLWTHKKGRDWTIGAFLQSLGIEVSSDTTTRAALRRALLKLIDEPLALLKKEAPLRAAFFNSLLHPDEVRTLLLWLNDASGYKKRCTPDEWASFCELCKGKYHVDPQENDILSAIACLGERQGAWESVWNRFKEAPHAYPSLPTLLRSARPQQPSLFTISESWPQDNETAESVLCERFTALRKKSSDDARKEINELEQEHAQRRHWVWAALGQSPLAEAIQYLAALAQATERALVGSTLTEITAAYTQWGWKADAAVINALASIERAGTDAGNAVKGVVTVLYRPWLETAAMSMQKAAEQRYSVEPLTEPQDGTCILFCDGLRYDIAQNLVVALESQAFICSMGARLAALPTITPTAKPAVSPLVGQFTGKADAGLELIIAGSGTKVASETFRKLLDQNGYKVLRGDELGDPTGKAWTEMGTIDRSGHSDGWKLAYRIKGEIEALKRRIDELINWGWRQVMIVTDHGWLLLPDNLPKTDLPEHLTYMRKGRCAQLKEIAHTDQQTTSWYWNNAVSIALAPGISCYEAGKEYEHGGISPQECIIPVITVSKHTVIQPITIENVGWRGLRCTMDITGPLSDIKVDIRSKAGDPKTSLIPAPKSPGADGAVSVLVEDEDRMGEAAFIVVIAGDGTICKQTLVTIGD